ncbi:MAG: hypothetical protein AABW46_00145 [Nanoarchaeota archaeon]
MFKRGQVTIYVVLGLVILVVVGGLFYFLSRGNGSNTISTLGSQAENVKLLIQNCFEENLLQALYLAGVQGGYIEVPDNSLAINEELAVAYGYFEGQDLLINKEEFALEIANYLNFVVEKCADFSSFNEFTIEKTSDPRSRLEIFDDRVESRLFYPVKVSRGSEVVNFEDLYVVDYNIRLGKMLGISKGIVEAERQNPDFIDVIYLKEEVEESGFEIDIVEVDVNNILYVISDDRPNTIGVEYVFQFANKF